MHALIDIFAGLVAGLAAMAFSQFGVAVHAKPAPQHQATPVVHRTQNAPSRHAECVSKGVNPVHPLQRRA